MPNEQIAEFFSMLSKLIDIHGDNPFKSKSYANAAFQVDKLEVNLSETEPTKRLGLKGITDNIAAKVEEILSTGSLLVLNEYIEKTPEGIIEMLTIKGLGPKKIHTIWKEMEIESIGELLYACNENRLTLYKGFGEKTQQNVKEAILFLLAQQGKFLYQQAESFVTVYQELLKDIFAHALVGLTGNVRRHNETIESIDFLVEADINVIEQALIKKGYKVHTKKEDCLIFEIPNAPSLVIFSATLENKATKLLQTTGGTKFIEMIERKLSLPLSNVIANSEEEIFSMAGINYINPAHRDIAVDEKYYQHYITKAKATKESIKGIIHSHSKWSDGSHTLEQMAKTAASMGFEYLVISDHSKAASYAGGLSEERIIAQHREIDDLNQQYAPFKIFKSIECDILSNGQLDYDDEVLGSFDLVIASVHSALKMNQEKAMQRLITAIENPYTLILGHMTGRLLLSRNGYPIDHKKIIDACASNRVVIELNAHPRRLDMDWRWIPYALEKDVLISINPDAHSTEGFADITYGCLAANKALLPADSNLSSFSLNEFEEWLYDVRGMKGTC